MIDPLADRLWHRYESMMRRQPLLFATLFATLVVFLAFTAAITGGTSVWAQGVGFGWSPQQRIPGYADDALPPYLIADRNRTVHAFSDQTVADDESQHAIVYSQWSVKKGWSKANDIVLSPIKNSAHILGAQLDDEGMMHVVFYGGDETNANIYYAKAPAVDAGRAPAWSMPVQIAEGASSPVAGASAIDDQGRLVVVYSGFQDGNGLYSVSSNDYGETWSEPVDVFLTYSDVLWPWGLMIHKGDDGTLHAIWNVTNRAGNGVAIYYSRLVAGDDDWQEPVQLAEGATGSLGTMHPTIIEHQGELIAIYIETPKIVVQRSTDGGQTWSTPVTPFAQHVGVNGTLSMVVDGNGELHLLFGQRITGNPDIHGMWHSIMRGNQWTPPVPVVSGPRVIDLAGTAGFDPFDAHAVVSQGDELLVTWRTDPGNIRPNGVWYSYSQLDAAELPVEPLPVPAAATTPTPGLADAETGILPSGSPALIPTVMLPVFPSADASQGSRIAADQSMPVVAGLVPVTLFLSTIIVLIGVRTRRQR